MIALVKRKEEECAILIQTYLPSIQTTYEINRINRRDVHIQVTLAIFRSVKVRNVFSIRQQSIFFDDVEFDPTFPIIYRNNQTHESFVLLRISVRCLREREWP